MEILNSATYALHIVIIHGLSIRIRSRIVKPTSRLITSCVELFVATKTMHDILQLISMDREEDANHRFSFSWATLKIKPFIGKRMFSGVPIASMFIVPLFTFRVSVRELSSLEPTGWLFSSGLAVSDTEEDPKSRWSLFMTSPLSAYLCSSVGRYCLFIISVYSFS